MVKISPAFKIFYSLKAITAKTAELKSTVKALLTILIPEGYTWNLRRWCSHLCTKPVYPKQQVFKKFKNIKKSNCYLTSQKFQHFVPGCI